MDIGADAWIVVGEMDPPGMMLVEGLIAGYEEAFNRAENRRQAFEIGEADEDEANLLSTSYLMEYLNALLREFMDYDGTWDTPEGNIQGRQALSHLGTIIDDTLFLSQRMRSPQVVVNDISRELEMYRRVLNDGEFVARRWAAQGG